MLSRPSRADVWGVVGCTAFQIALMAAAVAVHHATGSGVAAAPAHDPGLLGFFTHNTTVFVLWLAGMATLGIVSILLATVSSIASGLVVGGSLDEHGWAALTGLGHALFEIPALGIALWLAVRPAVAVARLGSRHSAEPGDLWRGITRALVPLVAGGLVLLMAAAAWEAGVEPRW